MIPCRGRLEFRKYNPAKSDTGYICNMEIYIGEWKTLQETVFSIQGPHLGMFKEYTVSGNGEFATSLNKKFILIRK